MLYLHTEIWEYFQNCIRFYSYVQIHRFIVCSLRQKSRNTVKELSWSESNMKQL